MPNTNLSNSKIWDLAFWNLGFITSVAHRFLFRSSDCILSRTPLKSIAPVIGETEKDC